MRKTQIVALLTAAILLLSGCAQLPRSSEVKTGPDLKSELTTDFLYYSPSGPTDGDNQTQIINGFLNAATGPQNDYQVARQYLTTEFSSKWSPNDEVLIQESRPELSIIDDNSAQLVVRAVAQIDAVGTWTSFPGSQIKTLDFTLVKENNQWRISSAPNATVLVKPVFDVLFKSYSLYFFDGQNQFLVPDLRWFSSRVSTGTRLVSALLKGPSPWLTESVSNAFPAGTKLALDAVTVENGTAVVDLNAAANKADKAARSRMLSQLTATLNQLPNVFSVRILIDHNPQDITLQNSQLPYPSNYSPMVLTAGGIRQVSQMAQEDKVSKIVKQLNAKNFGFSPDGGYLALSSASGVDLARVSVVSSELTKIDTRSGQLAPVIDNRSQVWTLPSEASAALQAHDINGKLLFSTAGWLARGEHLAFGISREGARIAILLKTKTGTAAYVAAIRRNELGYPVGIVSPRRVDLGIGTIKSISWSGPNSIAAIVSSPSGNDVPTNIFIGGGTSTFAEIRDAVAMIAQADSSTAFVLDENGLLFEYRGLSWSAVEADVLAAHFTGN